MNASAIQIRNDTNELRLLFEAGQAFEASGEIGPQMEALLDVMARHTAMLHGGVMLAPEAAAAMLGGTDAPPENGPAVFWHSRKHDGGSTASPDWSEDRLEQARTLALETLAPVGMPGESAASSAPVALHRGTMRTLYKEDIAFFCVPVAHGGRVFGILAADRLFADSVAVEEDVRLLQVIASLLAQALKVRVDLEARHSAVVEENRRLQAMLHEQFTPEGMVGNSAALRDVFRELTHVASSNATVLVLGESGTGKELTASAIHANSPRAGKPFVRLNCAALPEGLVESELFGHERGAFTGATGGRKGRFEMAHGGTLFLDEVGDLTALTQAKLLRVLQEKEFERVGGTQTIRVDVRLIAATNRDLEDMVAKGTFRQDLYYRLSVFPILLPPLRNRREDIMPLATHFAEKYGRENARHIRSISPEATAMLASYAWPGNIRELENVMERAVLLCGPEGVVGPEHLPPGMRNLAGRGVFAPETPLGSAKGSFTGTTSLPAGASLDEALSGLEKRLIQEALHAARGNMAKAAASLGVTERVMGLRMRKYGLRFKDFRQKP